MNNKIVIATFLGLPNITFRNNCKFGYNCEIDGFQSYYSEPNMISWTGNLTDGIDILCGILCGEVLWMKNIFFESNAFGTLPHPNIYKLVDAFRVAHRNVIIYEGDSVMRGCDYAHNLYLKYQL